MPQRPATASRRSANARQSRCRPWCSGDQIGENPKANPLPADVTSSGKLRECEPSFASRQCDAAVHGVAAVRPQVKS